MLMDRLSVIGWCPWLNTIYPYNAEIFWPAQARFTNALSVSNSKVLEVFLPVTENLNRAARNLGNL